jgi:hypothetical protein
MWTNCASLQSRLDRLINVDRVDPYYNHGSTTSSTSTVWIHVTTMARLLHQSRPCGSYNIIHNHCSTVSSKSTMRVLQASSQPWLDCFIKVGHAGHTMLFTTMARPFHQSWPCGSYKSLSNHDASASSKSVMWFLQAYSPPCPDCIIKVLHVDPTPFINNHCSTASSKSAMWILQYSSQPWLDRLIKVGHAGHTMLSTTMVATSTLSMWSKK